MYWSTEDDGNNDNFLENNVDTSATTTMREKGFDENMSVSMKVVDIDHETHMHVIYIVANTKDVSNDNNKNVEIDPTLNTGTGFQHWEGESGCKYWGQE